MEKKLRTPRYLWQTGLHEAITALSELPVNPATELVRPVDLARLLKTTPQKVGDALHGRAGVAKIAHDYLPELDSPRGRIVGILDGVMLHWWPLRGHDPVELTFDHLHVDHQPQARPKA